ncbi:hypothetical protein EGR_06491 [Echinococcus granulosus]|uniref:Uncharacterized protein n=1 Tax=Echinococcus granulosus TaxID=6210 RepID=W6UB47_ECHGR|nr:hypothetical protein EGR_06491 [Echinococcus granulosus]EUB58608.1 hypothetical protein EGR_06491 [Echinococcus granulosus]
MPRFELGLPPNLDSGRGLRLLQLLSLPPESVLEWFRLSWVGEKPHRNDQNGITPSTSFRPTGGNPLPSQSFDCRKVLEKNSQYLNESRLSESVVMQPILKLNGTDLVTFQNWLPKDKVYMRTHCILKLN